MKHFSIFSSNAAVTNQISSEHGHFSCTASLFRIYRLISFLLVFQSIHKSFPIFINYSIYRKTHTYLSFRYSYEIFYENIKIFRIIILATILCKSIALIAKCRSSRPEVFCKKGVLRNSANFTGKHLCKSLL